MGLHDDIRLLAGAPLLSHLDADALRLLAFAADRRDLAAGAVLFAKGDRSDGGFVVASGAIALDTGRGGPVATVGPGGLVGRTALFTATRRPATATAVGASSVLHVPLSLMRRMLTEFPDAARRLEAEIARDIADTSEALERVRARLLAIGREG
ncbi:MAG TPA: cyclic nucleotide-binding domain-containing protein [Salinarimonas sp.]|jgi:CRP-like cAMP-binding protein|nr:cyclic nucleotide-binding domain-containing protein [Salinarimonas sp.]